MSRFSKVVSVFVAAAMLIAACSDGGGSDSATVGSKDHPPGQISLIAEQWPECLNPVTDCAASAALSFYVLTHVLPRAMELDENNEFVASPVLSAIPTRDNGGLVVDADGTFTLTYEINPDAVWSDGTPITSGDFSFTWLAYLESRASLGYDLISSIDASDPLVAVIEFVEPYAPWPDLFGGTTQFLLPAHGFESADIFDEWNDEIPVSGGPWILESFSQTSAVLIPNLNYWEPTRIPLVDRVVIVPSNDAESQLNALVSGEAMAAIPQPFPGLSQRLVRENLDFVLGGGTFIEGLWINQDAPGDNPGVAAVNDPLVRKALIYSLDRQKIADLAIGDGSSAQVLQCAGWNPTFGDWCDSTDFEKYDQDFAKVTELLTEAGWTRDGDDLWMKDGEELVLGWNTVSGNERREAAQELVVEMTRPIGIGWEIQNYEASDLFQVRLPTMDFGPVAQYALSTSADPSVAGLYSIDGIPGSGDPSGTNYMGYRNQTASDLGFAMDREIDPAARLELARELGDILAIDVPWIPLYVLPSLLVWRTDYLTGPIADGALSAYGGFANMYDWELVE